MSTGYVYDDIFTKHNLPGHPENANRLTAVLSYLNRTEILPRLTEISSRPATMEELTRCHNPRYVRLVEETCRNGGGQLDADTYVNEYSFEAAIKGVGGLIDLTAAVVKGSLANGFALLRPPGHHATPLRAMGFCLFGTVAIAARAARFDMGLERVAIVDFDVHHGNGTQAILDEDPNILFVSSHQYPFYPGTGHWNEIGAKQAEGTKVNVPLSSGTNDEGFTRLYHKIVYPIIRRFQPELILVSAGFDAHWQDPLANIGLSLSGYHDVCKDLIALADEVCQGRIVFTLEGGYNLNVLAPGVGNVFRVLTREFGFEDSIGVSPYPAPEVTSLVATLKKTHKL